jgi:ATP-dependent RNA helicase RhlE
MTATPPAGLPSHPVATTDESFATLGLSAAILHCVEKLGFQHPTPIQAAVIPTALQGHDLIGLAETGSGKTAAFALPIADRLTHGRGLRGLILAPTREIAIQTKTFLDIFGKHHSLRTVCLIGGVKIGPQIEDLQKPTDIVVATPGRLVDHMQRRTVKLDRIEELVLDEGDHMLDMGFLPQVERILHVLPKKRHTMMFSATMPGPIERLAQRYMHDPKRIDITPEGRTATGISHRLYLVSTVDKKACILALLHQELGSTLVFIRRKMDADWLHRVLQKEGHPVDVIHSDRSQGQRLEALEGFREGEHRILVATDIAARGIDVKGIQHVINFDIPDTVDDYIHRGGRTARANAVGIVSTIATWMDKTTIMQIEQAIGQKLPRCTVPGVEPYVETKPRGRARSGRPLRK